MAENAPAPPWTVLVWPGGNEIGLEIRQSLMARREVRLISASDRSDDQAMGLYDRHVVLPRGDDPAAVPALLSLIAQEGIDLVFPAHPLVVDALCNRRADIPARVVLAPERTVSLTRSKRETLRMLEGVVPIPTLFGRGDAIDQWPVFVKPDRGYGSQRARSVSDSDTLAALTAREDDLLIQSCLPGEEYTVDCFSDHGRLLFAGARRRDRVWTGLAVEASSAAPDTAAEAEGYAADISSGLGLHGPWFYQMRADANGTLRLLEVEARMAGSMVFHRGRGINFALLAVYQAFGRPLSVRPDHLTRRIDRRLVTRFWHELSYQRLYIDLDDTLIVHGAVNVTAVRLVYQAINAGRSVHLITRNKAENLAAYLAGFRLSGLFDEVIQITDEESKSSRIEPEGSIFIDDSFSEREAVHRALGIPVFDVSSIDVLLDGFS